MAYSDTEQYQNAARLDDVVWRAGTEGEKLPRRMAVVGVGHELRGDDAAGLEVARRLATVRQTLGCTSERLLVLEGGPAPENVTGTLRRFKPEVVLLVDAATFGAEPGAVRWFTPDQAEGLSATTHTMPLSMLARYLALELDCRIYLLGIQPGQNDIGAPLSPAVERAVAAIGDGLCALFSPYTFTFSALPDS